MMESLDPKSSNYEQGNKVLDALRLMKEDENSSESEGDDDNGESESSSSSSESK